MLTSNHVAGFEYMIALFSFLARKNLETHIKLRSLLRYIRVVRTEGMDG